MKWNNRFLFFFGLIIIIVFYSCQANKSGNRNFPVDRILSRVSDNFKMIKSVKGEGTLDLDLKNFSNSADFDLSLLKNDSLKVNIFGPFGIEVANVLVTKKKTTFLNNFSNQVIIAETKDRNLKELIRINLEFDDLMNLLTGVVRLPFEFEEQINVLTEGNDYLLTYSSNDTLYNYWIDIRYMIVSKINLSRDNKILYECKFSDFYDIDGAVMPRQIEMQDFISGDKFKIHYKEIIINSKKLDFNLIIPEDAEIRKW